MTMDLQAAARDPRAPAILPPGSRFGGGRYTIGNRERRGPFGDLYQATDATSAAPVSIHLIDPKLLQGRDLIDRLAESVRLASPVDHESIARVIELAIEGEHTYVATELVDGLFLRELLDRKRDTGTIGFGARGALSILTQVAGALAAAAPCHGAVTVDSIAVGHTGRIRVTDLGLFPLVPGVVRLGRKLPGFPPEVVAGARPDEASDVYCLGALLYEVLVGAPPVKGCTRPSQALPGISETVDQIIALAMSAQPDRRHPSRAALVDAATQGLADAVRASGAMPSQPSHPFRAGGAPVTGRASGAGSFGRDAIGPGLGQPSLAETLAGAAPGASTTSAISAAMSAALADRHEKWLISKGRLDYGPFSLAHVVEEIQADHILPGHFIIDKDTGDRRKVEDHPLLADLVESARHKRDEHRRTQAEVQHATQEKRRGVALYALIALAVVALGGGAYFLIQKLSAAQRDNGGELESLEAGSLEANMSFPSKAERQKRAHRNSAARKSGGSAGAGVAGGWDDSLNLDLSSDGDDAGDSERLTDDQVNPVLRRYRAGLGRCLTSTGTHRAMIEFIVRPDGQVSQVRVNGQTASQAANCIRGVMSRMQFPSFSGVRSRHYFDMAY